MAAALNVFDYYCIAAAGDVVAEISESVAETYPTAESRTGSGNSGPEETAGGEGGDGGGGGVNKTAIIAASVLGGVVGIALIVGVGLYVRRRKKKASRRDPAADPAADPPHHLGTSELHDESKSNIAAGSSELTGQGVVELPLAQPRASELPGEQHHQAYELPTTRYEMDSAWRRG